MRFLRASSRIGLKLRKYPQIKKDTAIIVDNTNSIIRFLDKNIKGTENVIPQLPTVINVLIIRH